MDEETRQAGARAVERLEAALAAGREARHEDMRAAVAAIVAFRDRAVARLRAGAADREVVDREVVDREVVDREVADRANALLSLSYGAEFPLAGFHPQRLEQTREGLKALLDEAS